MKIVVRGLGDQVGEVTAREVKKGLAIHRPLACWFDGKPIQAETGWAITHVGSGLEVIPYWIEPYLTLREARQIRDRLLALADWTQPAEGLRAIFGSRERLFEVCLELGFRV